MWSKKNCCSQCICPMSLAFASTLLFVLWIFGAMYFKTGEMPWAHKLSENTLWDMLGIFGASFFLAIFYNMFNRFFSWICCRRCTTCDTSCSTDKK